MGRVVTEQTTVMQMTIDNAKACLTNSSMGYKQTHLYSSLNGDINPIIMWIVRLPWNGISFNVN